MSSLPLAFAPLPFDADPGAAFTDTLVLPSVPRVTGSGSYFTVQVPGEYFYYPLSLAAALFTSAVAGVRTAYYVLVDQNNGEIIRQGLSSNFGPSGVFSLVWEISLGTAYTDGSNGFNGPLPPRLLLPTYAVGIVIASLQAGDSLAGQVTCIKIPRRRPIDAVSLLSPTPLVS